MREVRAIVRDAVGASQKSIVFEKFQEVPIKRGVVVEVVSARAWGPESDDEQGDFAFYLPGSKMVLESGDVPNLGEIQRGR